MPEALEVSERWHVLWVAGVLAEVVGKAIARTDAVGDIVSGYSLLKTKDVDKGEEHFDEVAEGHIGVNFEDGGPETNGAMLVMAVANKGPELNKDFVRGGSWALREGIVKELPEHEKIVHGQVFPFGEAEVCQYWRVELDLASEEPPQAPEGVVPVMGNVAEKEEQGDEVMEPHGHIWVTEEGLSGNKHGGGWYMGEKWDAVKTMDLNNVPGWAMMGVVVLSVPSGDRLWHAGTSKLWGSVVVMGVASVGCCT